MFATLRRVLLGAAVALPLCLAAPAVSSAQQYGYSTIQQYRYSTAQQYGNWHPRGTTTYYYGVTPRVGATPYSQYNLRPDYRWNQRVLTPASPYSNRPYSYSPYYGRYYGAYGYPMSGGAYYVR